MWLGQGGRSDLEVSVEAILLTFSCSRDFNDSAGNADRDSLRAADTQMGAFAGAARFVSAPSNTRP